PIRSILADLAHRHDRRIVTLIYGNQDENDIAFAEDLTGLALPQFRLIHVLQHPGGRLKAHAGLISAEIIRSELPELDEAIFLISGPPMMVKAVESQLASLGIGPEQIRTDRFLGYA
ncbi:ferredoxin--NADP reductase, partial [Candidatus Electronema sp. TJ]|uniref:ferredoxin--NADP reductase n=1 Tax=Candidatus Electronema sp. TJ TaxID=3401573 RepID=UPI003AA8DA29